MKVRCLSWAGHRRGRNMRTDDRQTVRSPKTKSSDGGPQPACPGNGNSPPDRLLVSHALTHLRTDHQAVICRSYYQGLTIEQIAVDLGIAEATAKSRLHYALRELRQTLQGTRLTE